MHTFAMPQGTFSPTSGGIHLVGSLRLWLAHLMLTASGKFN